MGPTRHEEVSLLLNPTRTSSVLTQLEKHFRGKTTVPPCVHFWHCSHHILYPGSNTLKNELGYTQVTSKFQVFKKIHGLRYPRDQYDVFDIHHLFCDVIIKVLF